MPYIQGSLRGPSQPYHMVTAPMHQSTPQLRLQPSATSQMCDQCVVAHPMIVCVYGD